MAKKKKFKIPQRKGNRVKVLERQYKKEFISLLNDLFPELDIPPNAFFQRIAVTDCINPVTGKKEYGILFICNHILVSIVETSNPVDKSDMAFCLEGMAAAMNQCNEVNKSYSEFKYDKLLPIVFENSDRIPEEKNVLVGMDVANDEPLVFQPAELLEFRKIFSRAKDNKADVHIFSKATNPLASENFLATKKILKLLPNTRQPRI